MEARPSREKAGFKELKQTRVITQDSTCDLLRLLHLVLVFCALGLRGHLGAYPWGGGDASLRVGTHNKTADPRFCATTALSHCPCWFTAP